MAHAVVERVKLESMYGLSDVAIVERWPFVEVDYIQILPLRKWLHSL